jgi:hypothetical protein
MCLLLGKQILVGDFLLSSNVTLVTKLLLFYPSVGIPRAEQYLPLNEVKPGGEDIRDGGQGSFFRRGASAPVSQQISKASLEHISASSEPSRRQYVKHVKAPVAKPATVFDDVSASPGIKVGMFQTMGPFTGTYAISEEPDMQAPATNGTGRKPSRAEPFRQRH